MMKQHYLLPIEIEELEDGRFLGRCSKLPGLNVQAYSVEEVLKLAPKVARSLIAAMRSKKVPLPRGLTNARVPLRVQVLVSA
jgi:predicted RNase H-like HicB family nuclease